MSISKRVLGPLGIAFALLVAAGNCLRMPAHGKDRSRHSARDQARRTSTVANVSRAVMSRTKSVSPLTIYRRSTHERAILNSSTISSARIARLSHPCPT